METIIQKKICMLGDFAVGKTSLVRRFVESRFSDNYLSSIGVNITRKELTFQDGPNIRFLIWDLAGSNKFTGVQTSYILGSAGALIVCDLTRLETFHSLSKYVSCLHEVRPCAPFIIIVNKFDLIDIEQQQMQELKQQAFQLKARFFITSAKTGEGVESAFYALAQEIRERN